MDLKPGDNINVPTDNIVLFTTNDFNTAFVNVFSKDNFEAYFDLAPISTDHKIYTYQNYIYILNRFGYDNIQKISINENYRILYEESLGSYANPYDIIFLNEIHGLVSLYGKDFISLINLSNGQVQQNYSFSHLNDQDSFPELASLYLADDNIYLLSQQMNRTVSPWEPASSGKMSILDKNSFEYLSTIDVPCSNPDTKIYSLGDSLVFGCPGKWGLDDGKLISYNMLSDSFHDIITEAEITAALGISQFDIIGFVALQSDKYLITGYTDNYNKSLLILIYSGSIFLLKETTNGYFSSIEKDDQNIYLADRKITNPGIYILDLNTLNEIQFISTNLPPYQIYIKK